MRALFRLMGHRTVRTELQIEATPQEIWSVLTDASGYHEWNPTIVRVEGQYGLGARLTNHVVDDTGKVSVMKSKVVGWQPNEELHQRGGMPGALTFDHRWRLTPVEGGTLVVQAEEYLGVGVRFWDSSWVEPAYSRANEALKQRVLSLQSG